MTLNDDPFLLPASGLKSPVPGLRGFQEQMTLNKKHKADKRM